MSQFRPSQPPGHDGYMQPSMPAMPLQPLPPYAQPEQYQQYAPLPQQQPVPPRQPDTFRQTLSFLVVLFLIVSGIGGYLASHTASSSTTLTSDQLTATSQAATMSGQTSNAPQQTTAIDQSTPVQTASGFATFGDGTYQVGIDIKPGTYRTRTGSQNCYYERLKGFGGTSNDILANGLTDFPAIVTILAADKGFKSQNCGTWTSDLSQITTSKTSFDDGMYFINTDIAPGTYKDAGGSHCYYARLSNFTGTDDILANGLESAPTIITIAATDKGFETHGCGTWHKI